MFNIVKNHLFGDANKRTGAAAADIFLTLNGIDLRTEEKTFESIVLSVAEGKTDKSKLTQFLRESSQK